MKTRKWQLSEPVAFWLALVFVVILTLALLFLITPEPSFAGWLDTNEKARIEVYRLMSVDTAGTNNLTAAIVNNFVYAGMERVCEDLSAKERNKKIVATSGTRHYAIAIDTGYSVINLRACLWVDGDTMSPLSQLYIDSTPDIVWEKVITSWSDEPSYFYRWGDSMGFIPMPTATDTFLVFYTTTVSPGTSSIAGIPIDYRQGVVYWAAYLSAIRIGIDPVPFLNLYQQFVMTKKPTAGGQK